MKPRSLPSWRHERRSRSAGRRPEVLFWTAIGVLTLISLTVSSNDSSFHDFLGGRFPVADGFDWLKASLDAASGYLTDYGVRRPWNLPFNASSLWLGQRIGPDPLVSALTVKRLLAWASIATLLTALRPRLSLVSTAGLGVLLFSTLPRWGESPLHELIGQGLGYTHGSELNAFIFVNVALAWFVLGVNALDAGRFRRSAFQNTAGFAFLCLALQERPGTLGLLPALTVLVAVAAASGGFQGKRSPWRWRRAVSIVILAVLGWMLISGGQLALERSLAKSACGSIGANSGGSLMGMSTGQTWREGMQETKEIGLTGCGKALSRKQTDIAIERIRTNPLPFLNLLGRNTIKLLQVPSLELGLVALGGLVCLAARRVWRHRRDGTEDPPGNHLITGLAACGSLSVIAFQIIFFGEAGLRPSVPYSAFPFLLLMLAAEQGYRVIFHSPSATIIPSGHRNHLTPLMSMLLVSYIGIGVLLIQRQALRSAGYHYVTGSIHVSQEWLETWMAYRAISPSMGTMYDVKISPKIASMAAFSRREDTPLCLTYRRRGLPWGMPYGKLQISPGGC
ncbi:hypothetical protein [Synechococcus sp. FACHB-909]|uniref:hypothetical protein n=1 Tax=Synechococcus sp. FACHB-909 TaxID=2692863 RepID=UPI0016895F0F|nr:hypothetical protein [Synechococcus sp. FACHB-909]MBD2718373.1 hypothetical protein [Synechococcus sp. FACHB-909]